MYDNKWLCVSWNCSVVFKSGLLQLTCRLFFVEGDSLSCPLFSMQILISTTFPFPRIKNIVRKSATCSTLAPFQKLWLTCFVAIKLHQHRGEGGITRHSFPTQCQKGRSRCRFRKCLSDWTLYRLFMWSRQVRRWMSDCRLKRGLMRPSRDLSTWAPDLQGLTDFNQQVAEVRRRSEMRNRGPLLRLVVDISLVLGILRT